LSVELDKECENCGMKFRQHVSFAGDNRKITIKVYRYKCPFCNALIKKPVVDEIRKATIMERVCRMNLFSCLCMHLVAAKH
jgi:hypothetical protein